MRKGSAGENFECNAVVHTVRTTKDKTRRTDETAAVRDPAVLLDGETKKRYTFFGRPKSRHVCWLRRVRSDYLLWHEKGKAGAQRTTLPALFQHLIVLVSAAAADSPCDRNGTTPAPTFSLRQTSPANGVVGVE